MLPVIRVFDLTIAVGPLVTLAALWLGAELAGRALERLSPPQLGRAWHEAFNNASLWAFLAALVGGRLWYAAANLAIYQQNPWLLISLRPESLAYIPGLVSGLACLVLLLRAKRIPLSTLADALAIGCTVALALFSIRDYLVGTGYGMPLLWSWAPEAEGLRHPVQLYEAALLGFLAVGLWFALPAQPAQTFWRFVLGYSLIRLFVDAFRGDAWLLLDGIRGAQVVALAAALVATYVLSFYSRPGVEKPAPRSSDEAHSMQEL